MRMIIGYAYATYRHYVSRNLRKMKSLSLKYHFSIDDNTPMNFQEWLSSLMQLIYNQTYLVIGTGGSNPSSSGKSRDLNFSYD